MSGKILRTIAFSAAVALLLLTTGCGLLRLDARHNRKTACTTKEALLQQYPWLADETETWRQDADFSAQSPSYSDLGSFPIGNGHAFACTGTTYPLGTLENIIGPEYQKTSGFLGYTAPGLCERGQPVLLPKQSTTWVRRAGIVHSAQASADGLQLDVYDFTPPNISAIVRVLIASNTGGATRRRVGISTTFVRAGEARPDGLQLDSGKRFVRTGVLNAQCAQAPHSLVPLPQGQLSHEVDNFTKSRDQAAGFLCEIGNLRPGESAAVLGYMTFAPDAPAEQAILAELAKQSFGLLKTQYDDCQAWYAQGPQLVCKDTHVSDILDITAHICRAQQAYEGGYSPMDKYTYLWIRDSNGPIRYLSATGHGDDVKRALEYHWRGCSGGVQVGNNLPLDMQFAGDVKPADWSKAPVPAAEIASFVVLQHYWYWRATGDSDLIKSHWPYLRRCLLGQDVDERGTLPFYGDETYRFPGYLLFAAKQDASDYVSLEAQSADSGFEYCAAADALREMSSAAGHGDEAGEYSRAAAHVRDATERYYWQPQFGLYAPAMSSYSTEVHRWPFTPIDLRPLWIGYAQPDAHQYTNIRQALAYLLKPEGTLKMTPTFGSYVPMISGYALWDLAACDDPTAPLALKGLLSAADKAGGFAEMNGPDDKPTDGRVWGKHRFRPWEGGINAEAVLFYLTGLRGDAANKTVYLDPHCPPDWEQFEMKNLRVGACSFDLKVEGAKCTVTRTDKSGESWTFGVRGAAGPKLTKPVSTVTMDLTAHGAKDPIERKDSFDYGPPLFSPTARVLLLTWSKETADEYLAAYKDAVATMDTRFAWPSSYLRMGLFRPDGGRRVDEVVLDTSKYPGAFKRPEFWDEAGDGGKVLAEFKSAGGRVTQPQTVRTPPAPPGGLPGQ